MSTTNTTNHNNPTTMEPENLASTNIQVQPEGRVSDASATRELKGLAKQLDEEDRQAKNQAKRGGRMSYAAAAAANTTTATSTTAGSVPPPQQRFSEEEQKRRATYLQTGMKPGAVPCRNEIAFQDLRPTPVNQEEDQDKDEDKDKQEEEEEEEEIEVTRQQHRERVIPPDVEQGHKTHDDLTEGPLVEAFVVPDEEELPYPKSQSGLPIIQPTSVENSKDSPQENNGNTFTSRNALLLIGSLIGCFLIGAVLVVVLVLFVANPGGGSSSSSNNSNTSSNNNAVGPPIAPTPIDLDSAAAPSMPPLVNTPTVASPPTNSPSEQDINQGRPQEPADSPTTSVPTAVPNTEEENTPPSSAPVATPTTDTNTNPDTDTGTGTGTGTDTPATTPNPTPSPTPPPTNPPPTNPTPDQNQSQNNNQEQSTAPLPTPPPTPPPTTDPPTPPPTTEPPISPEPTFWPTVEPTFWPTIQPSMPTDAVTEEQDFFGNANENANENANNDNSNNSNSNNNSEETTLPPLDLATTARVVFTMEYTWDPTTPDPSQEEMDDADVALTEQVTTALTSSVDILETDFLKSEHSPSPPDAWTQTIWIDFKFEEGQLPPINTVQSAISTFSTQAYTSTARGIGPAFAETESVEWSLRIPEYASS